jgi:hypothetical protein
MESHAVVGRFVDLSPRGFHDPTIDGTTDIESASEPGEAAPRSDGHYSSRFTDQSCWYRIDSVSAQTDGILAMRGDVTASGDVAAALVRAWRVPTVVAIYWRLGDNAIRMDRAEAGQIAMTSTVVQSTIGGRWQVRALGAADLKGIPDAWELYELV